MGANASASLACGSDAVVPEEIPTFKIVLVGDAEVGKTSIFLRYTKNQFDYSYQPTMTVNIANVVKKVNIPYETIVSISMWDLPGREEMDLRKSYYTDVDAAIVVVDLSDPESIDMAGTWRQDILNNVYLSDDSELSSQSRNKTEIQKSLPILLVGNKLDKIETEGESEKDESSPTKILEETAEQHNFVGCVSVAAKENDGGVHAAMQSLIRYLLEKKYSYKMPKKKSGAMNVFRTSSDALNYAKTLGSAEDHTFVKLERINIKEFDIPFDSVNGRINFVEKASLGFLVTMRNFKKACCIAGLTDSQKASTEQCITSLRDQVKNETREDCLQAHEDGGFLKLVMNGTNINLPEPVQKVVNMFNNEVNPACKEVIRVVHHAKLLLKMC
ncbi:ras-related protein Rab-32B-like [Rhopilema esculentum]|uniref:ras-related protein Rab-32B-like n=1 Tax=Rhopilema esculentum TaxID=499914 RepID=UPI0031CEBF7D